MNIAKNPQNSIVQRILRHCLIVQLWLAWNSICRSGWLASNSEICLLVFRVLGFKGLYHTPGKLFKVMYIFVYKNRVFLFKFLKPLFKVPVSRGYFYLKNYLEETNKHRLGLQLRLECSACMKPGFDPQNCMALMWCGTLVILAICGGRRAKGLKGHRSYVASPGWPVAEKDPALTLLLRGPQGFSCPCQEPHGRMHSPSLGHELCNNGRSELQSQAATHFCDLGHTI